MTQGQASAEVGPLPIEGNQNVLQFYPSKAMAGAVNTVLPPVVHSERGPPPPLSRNIGSMAAAAKNIQETTMSDLSREEIDAKLSTIEARTDTKIARLEGKIDTLTATITAKFDALNGSVREGNLFARDSRRDLLLALAAVVVVVVGTFIALATYADSMFGRGMSVRDVVLSIVKEQQSQQSAPQKK